MSCIHFVKFKCTFAKILQKSCVHRLAAGRLGRKGRKVSIFFANSAPLREIIRPILLRADFLDSLEDSQIAQFIFSILLR